MLGKLGKFYGFRQPKPAQVVVKVNISPPRPERHPRVVTTVTKKTIRYW